MNWVHNSPVLTFTTWVIDNRAVGDQVFLANTVSLRWTTDLRRALQFESFDAAMIFIQERGLVRSKPLFLELPIQLGRSR